ncbi:MAG: HD domain-containing phosphohydrolase [Pseudomonadota bacterium]
MSEEGALERALTRERKARKKAEELLETKSRELYHSKKALEDAYSATVEVFANLFGERSGRSPESLRRLGRDAKRFALSVGRDTDAAQSLYMAAILCDLGKLALADEITAKPLAKLSKPEFETFCRHPQITHEALFSLSPLENVADIIYAHCELFDGSGYPQRLNHDEIPFDAQLLCIVKDFDGLLRGKILESAITSAEAIEYLKGHKDVRYSADLVDSFIDFVNDSERYSESFEEQRLTPSSLKMGMVLTRDLLNEQGILVLPQGQILTEILIEKLRRIAKRHVNEMMVYARIAEESECDQSESE